MSSFFGGQLKLSLFGQSHGDAIGITMDGFPAGMVIDMPRLLTAMARRAPGQSKMTTSRREPDTPEFLSGVLEGRTTGQPLCAIIRNTNTRSQDYGEGV
ncbi:MAG: chorismate synthase, partial [Aristaeellaceae bacterium]